MGKYDKLRKEAKESVAEAKKETAHFQEIAGEYRRVENVYKNAHIILDDIDKQFASATKLNKVDITFLFFATALQCVRQYFLTQFTLKDERPNDQDAGKKYKKHGTKPVKRIHQYYNPSLAEIIQNPVPFDAMDGTGESGFNLGISGLNHRAKTLGHDPILGWIFGTSNIATSTLTTWDFQSFHVKTGTKIARDKVTNRADTNKVLSYTVQKITSEGLEGKKKIAASLMKECIHLKSDVGSKMSLPFPIVSTISPELSEKLSEYGVDTANILTVGKQASYSILINFITAIIHGMLYDESTDGSLSLYQVRTRKILSYSNLIASASNVIAVAVMEIIGVVTENPDMMKKGLKYFDIGGLLVTCYRLLTDHKFIKEVKLEFIEHEWHNAVYGEEYKFMTEEK